MKRLLLLFLYLPAFGQVGQYLNTNQGVGSLTATLPNVLAVAGGTTIGPSFDQLKPYGWCQIAAWQQPPSNYTATAWTISNSGPAQVSVYIAAQYNNSSNIVAQWDAQLYTNVWTYYRLLSKYIPSNFVSSAVTTPATSSSWVAEQIRTNSAGFTTSNAVDVINAINLSTALISAPGNTGGTTATFPWSLWWHALTNGYPLL